MSGGDPEADRKHFLSGLGTARDPPGAAWGEGGVDFKQDPDKNVVYFCS